MITYIKWAGSKARFTQEIIMNAPQDYNRLIDPFCGANHIYTALMPKTAVLSDINWKLINVHQAVQAQPISLFGYLINLQAFYNTSDDKRAAYNTIRAMYNASEKGYVRLAAQFIFLNRAGFNGLYRENRKGEFNVPYGKKQRLDFDFLHGVILEHSEMLNGNVTFLSQPYQQMFKTLNVQAGDFIVLDPPYFPPETSAGHKYWGDGFTQAEQEELECYASWAVEQGAHVMAFNRDCYLARKTWEDWHIIELEVANAINQDGNGRGPRKELMFLSY